MGLNGFHKEEEVKAPSNSITDVTGSALCSQRIMGLEVFLSVTIPEGILAILRGN